MNQFEQLKTGKKEDQSGTAFETKEGRKFYAERLIDPESPKVAEAYEMLANQFGKEELDSLKTTKEAISDTEKPYLFHVAKNEKGEVVGVRTSAVVETVNAKGQESKKSALLLGCYAVTALKERGQGIWKNLFKNQEQAAMEDAKRRGLEVRGSMTEVHGSMEPILNKEGFKRPYIKVGRGYKELPYEQQPLDWDAKTGKPAEGAGSVPEHLMLKLASGENVVSRKELMEMIRGMFYYNNYPQEGYFKTAKAENAHAKTMKEAEENLSELIGKKKVYLFSSQEREAARATGIKFVEHRQKEDKAEAAAAKRAEKSEQKKEWKEHFGEEAKMQLEIEKTERAAKKAEKNEKEWEQQFGILAEIEKEKEEFAKTGIPSESIKPEQILKEFGLEKPTKSFEETEQRLAETLNRTRTQGGESLSQTERIAATRDFYLSELGYSVRYKGWFNGKAEILDQNKEPLKDANGKPLEFKTFFDFNKLGETPMINFLKEKLKENSEGKGAEKPEGDSQKAIEEKLSLLQKAENFGKDKVDKLKEGIARLGLGEKLGIGWRAAKKLAIEGGKDLAVVGLKPMAAIEQAIGEIVLWEKMESLKNHVADLEKYIADAEARKEAGGEGYPYPLSEVLENLRQARDKYSNNLTAARESVNKKGEIYKFLESLKEKNG